MLIKGNRFIIATLCYVAVCLFTTIAIKPFSIINFIGPAAGVASIFTIIWGYQILLSIVLGTIVFSTLLMLYTGETLDSTMLLIALLAICLQSFWTKHLTYKYIRQQRWLRSRTILLRFLFRVGPLASIVSASAVVVIAMLDVETFGHLVTYVFFSSWSGSVLVSIFLTSVLLFNSDAQKLNVARRWFVLVSSLLGGVAIALLVLLSQHNQQYQRVEQFERATSIVQTAIDAEVAIIREQLKGLSAFFKASQEVTIDEFNLFSRHIFRENSSVRAIEWVPIVEQKNRKVFEKDASDATQLPFYIKEQLHTGQLLAAEIRDFYHPIYYIYPRSQNEASFGVDLLVEANTAKTMALALKFKRMVASAPLTLIQDSFSNPGFFIFYPVLNSKSLNPYGAKVEDDQQVLNGYVVAVIQIEPFFRHLVQSSLGDNVDLFVQDITSREPFVMYGNQLEDRGRLVSIQLFDIFCRQWRVQYSEKEPWVNQSKAWTAWLLLIGVTLGGFLYQLLILLMAAYSIELSQKVKLKGKELLLAKENSDNKTLAKSHFLQTLSSELRTPIYAIKYFVAKFRQHPTFQQAELSIEDIANASLNLTQLIDTVEDLTEIEYGTQALQAVAFDFRDFLQRIETMLNASSKEEDISFKFFVNNNVPYIIKSDELKIQKLLIALAENATKLLSCNELSLSIKAHLHQFKRATLFFMMTPIDGTLKRDKKLLYSHLVDTDLSSHSTSMAMVKEVCQLFDGDVKLSRLPAGELLLSASIKIDLLPLGHDFS